MYKKIALALLVSVCIAGVAYAGFDQYGYNDTARIFNGTGSSWCQGKLEWSPATCDAYMGPYANDKLVMKWTSEWDRGNAEGWANGPYLGAWTSNEWNGNVEGGSGEVWHYKIVWVGPELKDSPYWREGGYAIWGQFEVVMDQGTAPGAGHMFLFKAIPNGYGSK